MPLFRRGPVDKPDWGKPASFAAYQSGYRVGRRGDEPLNDPEAIRALAVDATGDDIQADVAVHLYTSGYADGRTEREKEDEAGAGP